MNSLKLGIGAGILGLLGYIGAMSSETRPPKYLGTEHLQLTAKQREGLPRSARNADIVASFHRAYPRFGSGDIRVHIYDVQGNPSHLDELELMRMSTTSFILCDWDGRPGVDAATAGPITMSEETEAAVRTQVDHYLKEKYARF